MILYTLKCPSDHRFEAWFKDSAAYDRQAKRGLISCPTCASTEIEKAPMAPRISKGIGKSEEVAPEMPAEALAAQPVASPAHNPAQGSEAAMTASPELIGALREVVEKHCENVGDRFAEEARKMHYGEAKTRGIYGQAKPEETKALLEEGVDVVPLPWPVRNS